MAGNNSTVSGLFSEQWDRNEKVRYIMENVVSGFRFNEHTSNLKSLGQVAASLQTSEGTVKQLVELGILTPYRSGPEDNIIYHVNPEEIQVLKNALIRKELSPDEILQEIMPIDSLPVFLGMTDDEVRAAAPDELVGLNALSIALRRGDLSNETPTLFYRAEVENVRNACDILGFSVSGYLKYLRTDSSSGAEYINRATACRILGITEEEINSLTESGVFRETPNGFRTDDLPDVFRHLAGKHAPSRFRATAAALLLAFCSVVVYHLLYHIPIVSEVMAAKDREIADLRAAVGVDPAELAHLRETIREKAKEAENLEFAVKRLKGTIDSNSEEIGRLTAMLQNEKKKNASLMNNVSGGNTDAAIKLAAKLSEAVKDLAETKKQLARLTAERDSLNQKLKDREVKIAGMKRRLDQLNETLGMLTAERDSLNQKLRQFTLHPTAQQSRTDTVAPKPRESYYTYSTIPGEAQW